MKNTYLITGTSSGLGYELAKNLLFKSHNVIGISRNVGKSKNFKNYKNFKFYEADLSDYKIIPSLVKKILKKIKKLLH